MSLAQPDRVDSGNVAGSRIIDLLRRYTNRALAPTGRRVVQRRYAPRGWPEFMAHVAERGFAPKTIVDVGAASGTEELYEAFPAARIVLVEPLDEFQSALAALRPKYTLELIQAAAGARGGQADFHVSHDLYQSGMYPLRDVAGRAVRSVPIITLDKLAADLALEGPILLKIDVEGAELEVLRGAEQVLSRCEVVIVETLLFEAFVGQSLIADAITYMRDHGFVPFDVIAMAYSALANDLGSMDLAFVPRTSALRREQRWG